MSVNQRFRSWRPLRVPAVLRAVLVAGPGRTHLLTRRCRQQPPATALADARGSSSTGFAVGVLGLSAAVPELIVSSGVMNAPNAFRSANRSSALIYADQMSSDERRLAVSESATSGHC